MKTSEFIGGIFWLAMGILLSLWSSRYEIGSFIQPGPGFLPLIIGILLIFFSFILIGKGIKPSTVARAETVSSPPGAWKKAAYAVLVLLLATFLFEKIGYLSTVFLMIVFLMCGVKSQSWRAILLVAASSALGVHLVFVLLLKQPLPRGLLGIIYGFF